MKNFVRGKPDKVTALDQVKAGAPVELLPEMAKWGVAVLRFGPLKIVPRRLADLNDLRSIPATAFERELLWCEAIVAGQADQIRAFVVHKKELERCLLAGERECFRVLDRIERDCGLSFWLIATRIALLQVFNGIEAQKEYIAELKKSGARQNTIFLAYWWGVRAEDDTTFERYTLRLHKLMERADLAPEIGAYINYLLAGLMPPVGAEQALLARSNYSSIVDLYQILTDLFVTAVVETRPVADVMAATIVRLGLGSIDPRVAKALVLTGRRENCESCEHASLTIRDARLAALSNTTGGLPLRPQELEELSAAAELGAEISLDSPLLRAILLLLKQIGQRSFVGMKSADDLMKLGSMFDKLSLGGWCIAKALQARKPNVLSPDDLAKLRLLSTNALEPMLLTAVPPSNVEYFREKVQAAYQGRTTMLAAEFASGLTSFDSALHLGLNELFASEIQLIRLINSGDYEGALPISAKMNSNLKLASKVTLQAQVICLISLDEIEEALRIAVDWLLEDSALVIWLPLAELASALESSSRSFDEMVEKAILFDALAKYIGGEFVSLRAYATEDFVTHLGVEKPSQIDISKLRIEQHKLVFFYSEICTAPVLRLSIAYQTERELDDELISICRVLIKLDPENAETYEDRARELVRARSIKDAVKELQRSKVSIDQDALRAVIKKHLSEDYNRYIALLKAGMAVVDENYRNALLKAVSSGEISPSLFEVPENEASALFASIVLWIMGELAYSPEHGLDCYLSLRIRHGTLSGQLRGPAEREHIITRRDAATKEYQANQYWGQRLEHHLYPDFLAEIQQELMAFSRDYDNLIFEFTDQRIQVFGKEKPKGLFRLQITDVMVNSLASNVTVATTFDELIDACIDHFWALVDQSLDRIRQYIDDELRASIRDRFDALDAALQAVPGPQMASLSDAIRRARTETGLRLDAMRDWFALPTPNSSLPFEMKELVDIALTTIKGFRPEFNPIVSLTATDIPPLTGALHLFSDIFFILFENISLYSGDSIAPSIEIDAKIQDDMILVRVTNNVEANQDIFRITTSVDRARERIASGAYLHAVRSEGGTGLPKLAKLIRREGTSPHLKFGLSDDRKIFSVEFGVSVTVIEGLTQEHVR
ncbi:hypothetical protein J6524_18760 [Bradyrhizobium sp. WSM 1738]|uniref:hypothetical protein n=1 Tax=Bradyrhizobium hereditatis TaxID=2821405 RepID=UPI001CE354BA|nr:hypothetical protein [Bradyrhizobium hereditatis]MCA6116905.1 hypothetical protein [Bradyrhizobium hereditatis]